jgi:hypothetical protein
MPLGSHRTQRHIDLARSRSRSDLNGDREFTVLRSTSFSHNFLLCIMAEADPVELVKAVSIHDAQVDFIQPCIPIVQPSCGLCGTSLIWNLNGRSRIHCAQVNIIQPSLPVEHKATDAEWHTKPRRPRQRSPAMHAC